MPDRLEPTPDSLTDRKRRGVHKLGARILPRIYAPTCRLRTPLPSRTSNPTMPISFRRALLSVEVCRKSNPGALAAHSSLGRTIPINAGTNGKGHGPQRIKNSRGTGLAPRPLVTTRRLLESSGAMPRRQDVNAHPGLSEGEAGCFLYLPLRGRRKQTRTFSLNPGERTRVTIDPASSRCRSRLAHIARFRLACCALRVAHHAAAFDNPVATTREHCLAQADSPSFITIPNPRPR